MSEKVEHEFTKECGIMERKQVREISIRTLTLHFWNPGPNVVPGLHSPASGNSKESIIVSSLLPPQQTPETPSPSLVSLAGGPASSRVCHHGPPALPPRLDTGHHLTPSSSIIFSKHPANFPQLYFFPTEATWEKDPGRRGRGSSRAEIKGEEQICVLPSKCLVGL